MAAPGPLPAGLDPSVFERRLALAALRVSTQDCSKCLKSLGSVLLRQKNLRNVLEDPAGDASKRIVLFAEAVAPEKLEAKLNEKQMAFVKEQVAAGADVTSHEVVLGYEHLSSDEALALVLPAGMEVPSSFETIGQIAHFNLRACHGPYKETIGKIVLDKNKSLRTVINKVGELSNEFRTFDMEVLAGEANFVTVVKEMKMSFELDYSEVYWNSRLGGERQRVLALLRGGETVVDMMAGIGAMSCFAATVGCRVFCNDLNPRGAHWQRVNVAKNHLDDQIQVFNMCAREFVRHLAATEGLFSSTRTKTAHAIMNLPELALDFLDAFRGVCAADQTPGPTRVHCYCFARADPPQAEISPRIEAAMGMVPEYTVATVRDVAPKKIMYCVEFDVPLEVLRDTSKRRKVEP